MNNNAHSPGWLPGLAVFAGCVFFGYGFMLRVSPSVMVPELMREFAVGAAILGNLSAVYFYIYAALQIPIGVLLDRVGPRRTVTVACILTVLGTLLFALSHSLESAYLGRFLIGAGCALTWPGLLAVINMWFPARFALLAGAGQVAGMAGGVFGQAPLAAAVGAWGWRHSMVALAGAGLLVAILLWSVTRDRITTQHQRLGIREGLVQVMSNPQIWLAAVFGFAMTGPILTFGGLWGVPFLIEVYGYDKTTASSAASLIFVGTGCGALLFGWWSDRTGKRKPAMFTGSMLATLSLCVILYVPHLSGLTLSIIIFLAGAGASVLLFAFALAREHNAAVVAGIAIGIVNTAVVGSGALMQPLIGLLLDYQWTGEMVDGARLYGPDAFRNALSALPLTGLIGIGALLMARETRGQLKQPE